MREKEVLDALCNTGDAVFIVDADMRIVRWNKEAERVLKYSEQEVLNRECFRVISGKSSPDRPVCGHNCRVHGNLSKGALQKNFDILSQTGEGEPLWLNVSVIAPSDPDQSFVAHIVRDITREKNTRLALDQFLANLESHSWIFGDAPGRPPRQHTVRERPSAALSSREIEVLTLLAEGLSTKGLAQRLNISHFTARNHIQNILVKLDLHSKAQAVSYAFKKGIL